METLWIAIAFALGLAFRQFGLPPLVGYLAAGFALNAYARYSGHSLEDMPVLEEIAHLGVLLLLFTVGLKIRLRSVLRPEVLGGGLVHLTITCLVLAPVLYFSAGLGGETALLLAVALGFSSTVLAAKVLESRREVRAFHGRVAIGILILQDLVALAVLSAAGGHPPSLWALLVFGLPLLRPLLYRLLDLSGHDELLVLFGLLLALVIGGAGFHAVGLSAELGALLLGALLGEHRRTQELANALWGIKEMFLVGFFLLIGMSGLPSVQGFAIALLLVLLMPLKVGLFFFILLRFKLRARSAFLTALSLGSYSEFALIVANAALPEWITVLALTVAMSFVIAAPLNRIAHGLYKHYENRLMALESHERHADEQPVSLGMANVLIMGMGRVGSAAYDHLSARNERLVGLDSDPGKVQDHLQAGRRVLYADAEDPGFWQGLKMDHIRAVILSMADPEAKIMAAQQLRARDYMGPIVTASLYEDEAQSVAAAGADMTFLAFEQAGVGLAEHVREALSEDA